jgi:LPXTG-motif cell wall-anchored protein
VLDKNNQPVSFASDKDGIVTVQGRENTDGWTLQEDASYYLVETKAPDGYQLDATPIPFKITSDPKADGEYVNGFTIGVANKPKETPGYALPQTGGFGMGPLPIAGLVVAGGAAAVLAFRRLRNAGM